jgi:heat shock protein HspQ
LSDDAGVQPEEGQGAPADSPWAQYLERFPEEARETAQEVFKEWDGNVTKRFQEAAQFRQQVEPFSEVIQGWDPEAAQWGRQMHEAAVNNPKAIQEWYEAYAQEHGLAAAEQAVADLEDTDFADPDLGKVLQSQLGPLQQQIEAIQTRFEQQEQAARFEEAKAQIESQLTSEQERLGDRFNREAIEGLAGKYVESDPSNAIARAAQDWEAIYNQIEKGTLQAKVDASRPAAESGGVPDGAAEPITSLARANEIAREQLRAARAA